MADDNGRKGAAASTVSEEPDPIASIEKQTRVLIARGRKVAATELTALAASEDRDELKRKACVDLLKLVPDGDPGQTLVQPSAAAEVVLALRQSLEDMGRASTDRSDHQPRDGPL